MKAINKLIIFFGLMLMANGALFGSVKFETAQTCTGQSNGAIDLTINGTGAPFTFEWSTGASTEDLNDIPAGFYYVTITYHGGSTDPCGFEYEVEVTEVDCCSDCYPMTAVVNFGSIHVDIECEESSNFTYEWSDGGTGNDRPDLDIGTYCVTATSGNGCVLLDCWEVLEGCPAVVPLTAGDAVLTPSCNAAANSGAIEITSIPIAGYTFVWTGPNGYSAITRDISNLEAGEYCLVVRTFFGPLCVYAQGCFTIDPDGPTCCSDCWELDANVGYGSIDVYLECENSNGFTYEWSDGSTDQNRTGLEPGTYCLSLTSSEGCYLSGCWEVIEGCPNALELTVEDAAVNDCQVDNQNAIQLPSFPLTGYLYSWTGPNGFTANTRDIDNLVPGEYCVELHPIFGSFCLAASGCFDIRGNGIHANIARVDNNLVCISGSAACQGEIDVELTPASNTATFLWSGPDGFSATTEDISNLCNGFYSLTITDGDCTVQKQARICCCQAGTGSSSSQCSFLEPTPPLQMSAQATPSTDNNSADGQIILTNSGGVGPPYFYSWTGPDGYVAHTSTIDNLAPGEYCVTVTDGCKEVSDCFDISNCANGDLSDIATYSIVELCTEEGNDGSISVNLNTGYTASSFLWSTGATGSSISGLGIGNYSVTVTLASGGCVFTETITLGITTDPNDLSYEVAANDGVCEKSYFCRGELTETVQVASYRFINWQEAGCSAIDRCENGDLVATQPWVLHGLDNMEWSTGSTISPCQLITHCPYANDGVTKTFTVTPRCSGQGVDLGNGLCRFTVECRVVLSWILWPIWPNEVFSTSAQLDIDCSICGNNLTGNVPDDVYAVAGENNQTKYIVFGKTLSKDSSYIKVYDENLEEESFVHMPGDYHFQLAQNEGTSYTITGVGTQTLLNDSELFDLPVETSEDKGKECLVLHYNSPSELAWTKSFGSAKDDQLNAGTIDLYGNTLLTGFTRGTFQLEEQVYTTNHENPRLFLIKYNNLGELQWTLNGNEHTEGISVSSDDEGNTYLLGTFKNGFSLNSISYPTPLDDDSQNLFIAKIDHLGNVLWFKPIYSEQRSINKAQIKVGPQGRLIIAGEFVDHLSLEGNEASTFQKESGKTSSFLAQYSAAGNLLWLKEGLTSEDDIQINDLEINNNESIILSGNFKQTAQFGNEINSNSAGEEDLFIAEFDMAGNIVEVNIEGGTSNDNATAFTMNQGKIIYVGYHYGNALINGEEKPGTLGTPTEFIAVKDWTSASNSSNASTEQFSASNLSHAGSGKFLVEHIQPNPFTDRFDIKLAAIANDKVNVQLVNNAGIAIQEQSFEIVKGTNLLRFSLAQETPSGIYYVKITNQNGIAFYHKVVKMQ